MKVKRLHTNIVLCAHQVVKLVIQTNVMLMNVNKMMLTMMVILLVCISKKVTMMPMVNVNLVLMTVLLVMMTKPVQLVSTDSI